MVRRGFIWHNCAVDRSQKKFQSATRSVLRFISSPLFFRLTVLYFVTQAVFFAVAIKYGIPPDEPYHYDYIRLFATANWPLPFISDQSGYYHLGEVTQTPFFLYHYLLSIPYVLFLQYLPHPYIGLRLISVLMGVLSLFVLRKLCGELKLSPLVSNLVSFSLSSTLVFVMVFASISYDSLAALLGFVVILFIVKLVNKPTILSAVLLVTAVALGSLTKVTFLPIALFAVLVLLIISYKQRSALRETLRSSKKSLSQKYTVGQYLIAAILVFSTLLAVVKYMQNIVVYSTFQPECDQVLTVEQCRQNSVYARNEKILSDGNPKIDLYHLDYVGAWATNMGERTFGVFGHKQFTPNPYILWTISAIFVAGIIATIRLMRPRRDLAPMTLGALLIFSTVALMIQNYNIYRWAGHPDFAVQGRYLLATFPLVYIILYHYLFRLIKRVELQSAMALVIIFVFTLSGPVTLILRTGPEWYPEPISGYISVLRDYL